jgi:hypothetical protein
MPAQTVIQVRRDTAANWASTDPTLAAGEFGYETDTGKYKVGNGTTAWLLLPYAKSGATFAYSEITDKPSSFTPSAHASTHGSAGSDAITVAQSQVTDLTTDLGNKQDKVTGVSDTEIGYLDGVTSAIQTQLDGKVDEVNGAVTTADTASTVVRNITLATGDPTGGMDGDVWLKYTP